MATAEFVQRGWGGEWGGPCQNCTSSLHVKDVSHLRGSGGGEKGTMEKDRKKEGLVWVET